MIRRKKEVSMHCEKVIESKLGVTSGIIKILQELASEVQGAPRIFDVFVHTEKSY